MSEIVVPDPEPSWESALQRQGVKRNPTHQYFTFDQAIGDFQPIAVLKVNIEDITRRLRLKPEPGYADQLGPVDVAFFAIRKIGFAVHRYGVEASTMLSLHHKDQHTAIEATDVLLETLGVDWRAVATVAVGAGFDSQFIEPVLDDDLRPTFPDTNAASPTHHPT
jgi:hypothetical protein